MSDQARDGRTTGMILTQHLAKKDPQGDQRRKDAVEPDNIQCFQCLRYSTFGKYIIERQFAVLEELPSQKTHLFAKSSADRKRHREASLPEMGVCQLHLCKRGLFHLYQFGTIPYARTTYHSTVRPV